MGVKYYTNVLNFSLTIFPIPDMWKIRKVVPLRSPEKPANLEESYRQITLLCPLADHQHDFRKVHNTTKSLNVTNARITRDLNPHSLQMPQCFSMKTTNLQLYQIKIIIILTILSIFHYFTLNIYLSASKYTMQIYQFLYFRKFTFQTLVNNGKMAKYKRISGFLSFSNITHN